MNQPTAYPKTMTHPHHRKGTYKAIPGTGKVQADGTVVNPDYQGTADRFPPMFVNNADQEDMARAQGYLQHGEAMPAMKEGTEYPLMLVHPKHEDAIPDDKVPHKVGNGPVSIVIVPGKPEKFPHVTVHDEAQEKIWTAKGWDRPGVCDPQAVEDSRAMPYDPNRPPGQEWPKIINGVLTQDPDAVPEAKSYPMWITTGKDPNTGDPIGKAVENLEEHIALCKRLGMPEPGVVTPSPLLTVSLIKSEIRKMQEAAVDAAIPVPAIEETTAHVNLTRGQKIAATKARKKAERLAVQQSEAAA